MIQTTPVILCGGSGTRLWPLSRSGFPKQFLSLTGNESLFQQAAQRLAALGDDDIQVDPPLIVTGEEHRFLAAEQLREIGLDMKAALLEPIGRNTAPALTLAALAAQADGQDPVLVVTPADQTIADTTAFTAAMQTAVREASHGNIVILGITPDRPETGYGYIKTTSPLPPGEGPGERENTPPEKENASAPSTLTVDRFSEKPDAATARQYLAEGGYDWHAGMFVLKASVWLQALEHLRPDILKATQAAWAKRNTDQKFIRPGKPEFTAIPSESIDYAVMEPATHPSPPAGPARRAQGATPVAVPSVARDGPWPTEGPGERGPKPIKMVPLDAGWNDLGAWDAVWNVLPKDDNGNAHRGDVLTTDSRNTLVHASARLVSLVGVNDLIVIETADAVLVADKSCSQDVKHIVSQLQQTQRENTPCTARYTAPGAGTTASTTVTASRSNASRSNPKPASACKNTTTAPSTGSSSKAPPKSPAATRSSCSAKTSPPTSRSAKCIA